MKTLEKVRDFYSKYLDTRIILVIDLIVSVVSSVFIFLGAIGFTGSPLPEKFLTIWLISSAIGSLIMFFIFKSHHIIIRHSTLKDLAKFLVIVGGKIVIMALCLFIFNQWFGYRIYFLLVVDALMTYFLLIATRVVMVLSYGAMEDHVQKNANMTKVLVYGHRNKSAAIVLRLISSQRFLVEGFFTPEKNQAGRKLLNKPIFYYNTKESFLLLLEKYHIDGILFPNDTDLREARNTIIPWSIDNGKKVFLAPSIEDADDDTVAKRIREVKIEDLLGRDEINISMDLIKANFHDKVVMVTGAAGSIGSELCRQLATFGIKHLVLFDNAETPMHELRLSLEEQFPELSFSPIIGDVRQEARLDYVFRKYKPQVVFHAAAYKHVPLMEENPCEAVQVNVRGSRNVADKCVEYGAEKMVMISTDKAVNPTNIMGCTKRLAEIYVQSLSSAIAEGKMEGKTLFVTTRFGNVLGSHGSVIPRFREQIEKGGPVTVTHPDITRFFMTIPEACRLVMEAATISKENNIFVFDMGESVKIDTLARRMIKLSGLEPDVDIEIKYTGLRPGEKLFEEVLADLEGTVPTSHDRIRIANVRKYDYSKAVEVVDELAKLSRAVDIDTMVKKMKETVPEFKSKNSIFEQFDK